MTLESLTVELNDLRVKRVRVGKAAQEIKDEIITLENILNNKKESLNGHVSLYESIKKEIAEKWQEIEDEENTLCEVSKWN